MTALSDTPVAPNDRLARARALHWVLAAALLLACCLSLQTGAVDVTLTSLLAKGLRGAAPGLTERIVLLDIRLPRLAIGGLVGAVSGGIGFIGIVVQHLLRLASGPDHRTLVLNSALLGATLLIVADVIARVVIAPAELPIGIITTVLGAPVSLWILLKRRGLVEL